MNIRQIKAVMYVKEIEGLKEHKKLAFLTVEKDETAKIAKNRKENLGATLRPWRLKVKPQRTQRSAKDDYNLSPSRYLTQDGGDETMPLEDAIVQLKEANVERKEVDERPRKILKEMGA